MDDDEQTRDHLSAGTFTRATRLKPAVCVPTFLEDAAWPKDELVFTESVYREIAEVFSRPRVAVPTFAKARRLRAARRKTDDVAQLFEGFVSGYTRSSCFGTDDCDIGKVHYASANASEIWRSSIFTLRDVADWWSSSGTIYAPRREDRRPIVVVDRADTVRCPYLPGLLRAAGWRVIERRPYDESLIWDEIWPTGACLGLGRRRLRRSTARRARRRRPSSASAPPSGTVSVLQTTVSAMSRERDGHAGRRLSAAAGDARGDLVRPGRPRDSHRQPRLRDHLRAALRP